MLIRERISPVSFAFFLLTLFVSIWLLGFSFAYLAVSAPVALWWSKAAYLGVPFIAPATHQFTVSMLSLQRRKLVWFGWLGAAFFSVVAVWSGVLVETVRHFSWGYYTQFGWLGSVFLIFFAVMLVIRA